MPHPLEQRVDCLRRRTRRWSTLRGAAAVVATAVAVAVVLGWLDWLVRPEDRGLRVLFTLGWLAATAVAAWRWLLRPLFFPLRRRALALWVERRRPLLEGKLAAAIEFLADRAPGGSAALRQRAIDEAATAAEGVDFDTLVDRRPALRAVAIAAVGVATVLALLAFKPAWTAAAAARLVWPLADATWPRRTHLVVRPPVERVARGRPFEVEVSDAGGGDLPADLRIEYRLADAGDDHQEIVPLAGGRPLAVARRENVLRSFAYRLKGGDDLDGPWRPVAVVDAPRASSLAVRVWPPPYTGLAEYQTAGHIEAIEGSRWAVVAEASTDLRAAELLVDGRPAMRAELESPRRFRVPPAGVAPPLVADSTTYGFRLLDVHGIEAADRRWEIRARRDEPPTVSLVPPAGELAVLPTAIVPLRVEAADDLGLARVQIIVRTEGAAATTIDVFEGPSPAAPRSAAAATGQRRSIDYRLDVARLGLSAGQQATLVAAADDYRPQSSTSESLTLAVIGREELQERLAAQHARVAADLARVRTLETESGSAAAAVLSRANSVERLGTEELDRMHAALLAHRQAAGVLTRPGDGLPLQLRALESMMTTNRLAVPPKLASLRASLDRWRREALPRIERHLSEALRSGQVLEVRAAGRPADDPILGPALSAAAAEAAALVAELEAAERDWGNVQKQHRLVIEWDGLARAQEALAAGAAKLAFRTLGRTAEELPAADRRALEQLADEQLELARRMDAAAAAIRRAAAADDAGRERLARAADALAAAGLSERMRQARGYLQQNRMAQAADEHRRILEGMRSVARAMQAGEGPSADAAASPPVEWRELIDGLVRQQQTLLDQTRAAAGKRDPSAAGPLAIRQRAVGKAAREAAAAMAQTPFGLAVEGAAGEMDTAAGELQAARFAPAIDHQRRAGDRLKLVAAALEEPAGDAGKPSPPSDPKAPPRSAAGVTRAELKMVELLQEDLRRRTAELPAGDAGAAARLADEQRRLLEIVHRWIAREASTPP